MKKIIFCFVLLVFSPIRALGQDFIPGTEDIPLMEGLSIDENETVIFDSPDGQIMTVLAKTSQKSQDVKRFYKASLTALGWKEISPSTYQRGQDALSLTVSPQQDSTSVKFQITIPNN